jgi:hypothetical protein
LLMDIGIIHEIRKERARQILRKCLANSESLRRARCFRLGTMSVGSFAAPCGCVGASLILNSCWP